MTRDDRTATADRDGADGSDDDRRLGRFTEWFRNRPTSLEFWEVLIADERLVWCFAGESFSSQLLRADMGERTRRRLDDAAPADALALDGRNFAVPLEDVRAIRLRTGTRTRRARLTVEWVDAGDERSWTLSNTARGDDQRALVESLADDPRFADATVEVRTPRLPFL